MPDPTQHTREVDPDDRTKYLLDEIAHQLERQADALERIEEQLVEEGEVPQ